MATIKKKFVPITAFEQKEGKLTIQRKNYQTQRHLLRLLEVKEWICDTLKLQADWITSSEDFCKWLRSGVILCQLSNALKANSIPKINNVGDMKFKNLENILFFLQSCVIQFGLKPSEMFDPTDLYESRNPAKVVDCLHRLFISQSSRNPGLKKTSFKYQEFKKLFSLDVLREEIKLLMDSEKKEMNEKEEDEEVARAKASYRKKTKSGRIIQYEDWERELSILTEIEKNLTQKEFLEVEMPDVRVIELDDTTVSNLLEDLIQRERQDELMLKLEEEFDDDLHSPRKGSETSSLRGSDSGGLIPPNPSAPLSDADFMSFLYGSSASSTKDKIRPPKTPEIVSPRGSSSTIVVPATSSSNPAPSPAISTSPLTPASPTPSISTSSPSGSSIPEAKRDRNTASFGLFDEARSNYKNIRSAMLRATAPLEESNNLQIDPRAVSPRGSVSQIFSSISTPSSSTSPASSSSPVPSAPSAPANPSVPSLPLPPAPLAARGKQKINYAYIDPKKQVAKRKKSSLFTADEIIPGLFLGDQKAAHNLRAIQTKNISHVLTLIGDHPFDSKLKYLNLDLNDSVDQTIRQYFEETNQFIEDAINDGGGVLVHCQKGVSRSATIVIAFLMKTKKMNFYEAADFVCQKRPIVCPNLGFIEQLKDYEIELKKE